MLSDEEIKQKKESLKNKNTQNADKRAETAFRNFLSDAGCDSTEFWFFTEHDLDSWLSKFWFGARTVPQKEKESDMYSVNTLRGFAYGINRILRKHGHEYDITKSLNFRKSQDAYKAAIKELKEHGKGYVKSAEEIDENGN